MTVSYFNADSGGSKISFYRFMARWKGSVYKLLWKDLLLFTAWFIFIYLIFKIVLTKDQKQSMLVICEYADGYWLLINPAWPLGLYIGVVVDRFYSQIDNIPFLTRYGVLLAVLVRGHDDHSRLIRRTVVRYLSLANVITFISISPSIVKRFPTLEHLTNAGFLNPEEQKMLEDVVTSRNKFFIPLVWAASVINRARSEGLIADDMSADFLIREIVELRDQTLHIFYHDWVPIPIIYTQVVAIAVYTFLFASLLAKGQYYLGLELLIYPVLATFAQFVIYMGWLKVGEQMLHPFGDDDDDFNSSSFIDNSMKTAFMVVDEIYAISPELTKDVYFDNMMDSSKLLHNQEMVSSPDQHIYTGLADNMNINEKDAQIIQSAARHSDVGGPVVGGEGGKGATREPGAPVVGSRPTVVSGADDEDDGTIGGSTSRYGSALLDPSAAVEYAASSQSLMPLTSGSSFFGTPHQTLSTAMLRSAHTMSQVRIGSTVRFERPPTEAELNLAEHVSDRLKRLQPSQAVDGSALLLPKPPRPAVTEDDEEVELGAELGADLGEENQGDDLQNELIEILKMMRDQKA